LQCPWKTSPYSGSDESISDGEEQQSHEKIRIEECATPTLFISACCLSGKYKNNFSGSLRFLTGWLMMNTLTTDSGELFRIAAITFKMQRALMDITTGCSFTDGLYSF
jgi:hypothetical protein